jgi:DNA-directed RNA polymerase specialized sigma24 family protein
MGERISAAELRRRRREGDLGIDKLIHQQLLADVENKASHSEGLLAVNIVWKRPVCRFVIGKYLSHDEDQQEVWIQALALIHARIRKYDFTKCSLATWVFNQGKYAALNDVRRRHRERRADEAAYAHGRVDTLEFDMSSFTERENRAARRALKRLSENERRLVEQRVLLDRSYDEMYEDNDGSIKREHLRIYVARAISNLKRLTNEELERG